jgi:ribokinase
MSTEKPRIVVVGSINIDLVVTVERFPVPGETIRSTSFVTVPGGKGANQAAAAALAGGSVTMVGRVGRDIFGSACLENLRSKGVNIDFIKQDDQAPTGNAMIAVDTQGQNELIYTPGANHRVTIEDATAAKQAIADAQMVILQFELPMMTVRGVVQLASELGTKVVVNPAPAEKPPACLLEKVDYLVPNETEAELLTGVNVTDPDSAAKAADRLLNEGCKHVIVTLGAQGALVHDGKTTTHVPARSIQVVDATAAGDTFIGAFSVSLATGEPLVEAVRFGCAAATLSVSKLGAQTSIPTRQEIERFMYS